MTSGADDHRRLRWLGPVAGIGALSAVSFVGTSAAPFLVDDHPLVLMALSPRLLHLTIAAGDVPFAAFFIVGFIRLLLADPLHYLLGRHSGDRIQTGVERRSPRAGLALERGRRAVQRGGPLAVAVRPIGSVLAAAGACGLRALPTALADVAGTAVHVVVLYHGGRFLGPLTSGVPLPAVLVASTLGTLAVAAIVARPRPLLPVQPRPRAQVG